MSRLMPVRTLFRWVYVLLLISGALLCLIALVETARYYGQEPLAFSLRRGIPASILLVLCFAHARVLWLWGFVFLAVPVFLCSYAALGLVVHVAVDGMAKGFPPDFGEDVTRYYWGASAVVLIVGLICAAGVVMIQRRAAALQSPVNNLGGG